MAVKAQFIAGQWLPGSGATMSKLAPEDQSLLWQAASAGADDVQAACAAARAAFYPWSHRPLAERIDVVQRFAALLETHKEALATLISRETSKPLWETRTEVQAMIGKAAISIEAYHQRTGFHESTLPDGKALLRHKPHGVMAVFGPYNFPGHLPNGHIIPALIAGNTIVFKPSELTPATAEMTVQLWQQAGIPDGAINLLQGGKATGQALLENRDIDGVLFTGSAAAGFHFHRYFGGQPEKMLALEMGGNNALIVADVADIDAALHVIIQSAFISAGQRCTCARRLIVPRGEQGDALLQRLVEASAVILRGFIADGESGVVVRRADQAIKVCFKTRHMSSQDPLSEWQARRYRRRKRQRIADQRGHRPGTVIGGIPRCRAMVTGGAHPAKRRFTRCAGQRLVPVDDPGSRLVRQLIKLRRIAGDQPDGQAIAGLIGEANRLREAVVTDNRQQRAKVLFIRHLNAGDVDDPRGQHRGARVRLAHAQQHLAAEPLQFLLRRQHVLRSVERDHPAHKRRRLIIPLAGADLRAGLYQPLQQRIPLLAARHDQPARAGAALPGRDKRRLDNHM